MGSSTYVMKVVKNVKKVIEKEGYEFNRKLSDINYSPKQPYTTMPYRSELDILAVCNNDQIFFYQHLI